MQKGGGPHPNNNNNKHYKYNRVLLDLVNFSGPNKNITFTKGLSLDLGHCLGPNDKQSKVVFFSVSFMKVMVRQSVLLVAH